QAIALAVRHAFDHRPDQVGARVAGGQADPTATRGGVEVRSALAHQVWKPEETLRAGGRFGGVVHERVVSDARRKLIPEPLKTEARPLRDAHDVPLPGN